MEERITMYKYVKRVFDFCASLLLLICISPVFAILILVIRIKLGTPIFFIQERSTIGGRSYKLIKFRTMTDRRDTVGNLLADSERKTPFGTWLRNTSLDELPELLNIVKGDMSVIGPRSMLIEYNDYYTEYEKNRFLVRGGLLPPEILENNPVPTWNEQLKWEADYGKKCSIILDWKILMKTFQLLIHRANSDYGDYTRGSLIEERTRKDNNE